MIDTKKLRNLAIKRTLSGLATLVGAGGGIMKGIDVLGKLTSGEYNSLPVSAPFADSGEMILYSVISWAGCKLFKAYDRLYQNEINSLDN